MPHDTDRTQLEFGAELQEYGASPELSSEQYENTELGDIMKSVLGETPASYEGGGYQEYQEMPLSEVFEDELASELLEVQSEHELDHFLGNLFNKVASTIGKAVHSPIGQALGGVLKQVAKQALPIAGKAAGAFFGGPAGALIGGKLASAASDAFGLEMSGLSSEDRDFETARRYVRFASEAARRAARARTDAEPIQAARKALVEAAGLHAPGLLAPATSGGYPVRRPPAGAPRQAVPVAYPRTDYDFNPAQGMCSVCSGDSVSRRTGKWIRRGHHIVLLGA
jgi:hypothetical protein